MHTSTLFSILKIRHNIVIENNREFGTKVKLKCWHRFLDGILYWHWCTIRFKSRYQYSDSTFMSNTVSDSITSGEGKPDPLHPLPRCLSHFLNFILIGANDWFFFVKGRSRPIRPPPPPPKKTPIQVWWENFYFFGGGELFFVV